VLLISCLQYVEPFFLSALCQITVREGEMGAHTHTHTHTPSQLIHAAMTLWSQTKTIYSISKMSGRWTHRQTHRQGVLHRTKGIF